MYTTILQGTKLTKYKSLALTKPPCLSVMTSLSSILLI